MDILSLMDILIFHFIWKNICLILSVIFLLLEIQIRWLGWLPWQPARLGQDQWSWTLWRASWSQCCRRQTAWWLRPWDGWYNAMPVLELLITQPSQCHCCLLESQYVGFEEACHFIVDMFQAPDVINHHNHLAEVAGHSCWAFFRGHLTSWEY